MRRATKEEKLKRGNEAVRMSGLRAERAGVAALGMRTSARMPTCLPGARLPGEGWKARGWRADQKERRKERQAARSGDIESRPGKPKRLLA